MPKTEVRVVDREIKLADKRTPTPLTDRDFQPDAVRVCDSGTTIDHSHLPEDGM